jgi:hypothetical protein
MQIDSVFSQQRHQIIQIASGHGASNIRVFGSRARGDDTTDSDLDILVELEPGRTLLDLVAIKQDLGDLLGCQVDVVTEASISPYIREQVLKDAIRL